MIYKHIEKNREIIAIGFLLSSFDALTTVIGLSFGGRELMAIANFFLQYGYGAFAIFLICFKMILVILTIIVFQVLQNFFNKKTEQDESLKRSFLYDQYLTCNFIPFVLIVSNLISTTAVVSNIHEILTFL